MPSNETRAEYGVLMNLMNVAGHPYRWDGEELCDLRGDKRHKRKGEWVSGHESGYLFTRPEGVRVLPPLEPTPEPSLSDSGNLSESPNSSPIVRGSFWRRNSDGKLCVVADLTVATNPEDSCHRLMDEDGCSSYEDVCDFLERFTYAYTCNSVADLMKLKDGAKLIDYVTGEMVTFRDDRRDGLGVSTHKDNTLHSVNGLPSIVGDTWQSWCRDGCYYRIDGPARCDRGGNVVFHLGRGPLSPTEWADRRVADGATPADVEEPWRYLIEEAMERAKPKSGRYTVRSRNGYHYYDVLLEIDGEVRGKIRSMPVARAIAKLLNEALEAKEAGDGE